MKRSKIDSVLALILAVSVLICACSPSSKKPRRNRDDDDERHTGFTRQTVETTEVPAETAAVGLSGPEPAGDPVLTPEAAAAFAGVLASYEDEIRAFEDDFHSWRCPSINLVDVDLDGVYELAFKYVSDQFVTSLAIYDYEEVTRDCRLYLDIPVDDDLGSWGLSCDVVLAGDGTILVMNERGMGGSYDQTIDEYTITGSGSSGYTCTGIWTVSEEMPDGSWECVPVSATYNVSNKNPDEFYEAQQGYVNSIIAPIMPYSSRLYYDDYTVRDIFDRDWNSVPGSVFAQGEYLFYDEFLQMC